MINILRSLCENLSFENMRINQNTFGMNVEIFLLTSLITVLFHIKFFLIALIMTSKQASSIFAADSVLYFDLLTTWKRSEKFST